MSYRVEGWCIIDSRDGSRWGALYESESGAKVSFMSWTARLSEGHEFAFKKFSEQSVYVLKPLILIQDEEMAEEIK